jgi:glycosyltransferase involved in cell wall biosynthesis
MSKDSTPGDLDRLRQDRARYHVAIALYGDLTYDTRVRKEARTLALDGYRVTVVCLANEDRPGDLPAGVRVLVCKSDDETVLPGQVNPFRSSTRRRLASLVSGGAWIRAYAGNLRSWGRSAAKACGKVDFWHASDLTGLAAIAPAVGKNVPVVYDSHELFLDSGTASRLPAPVRALLRRYEGHLVANVPAVITVNDEIADVLGRRYRPKRLEVVHNCPDSWDPPKVRPDLLRASAGIPQDSPVVLHHGRLVAGRGIENLIAALAMPGLEKAHLVLMGFGPSRDALVRMTGDPRSSRIHVLEPVPPSELLGWVASADVGAMPNMGLSLNDRYSTPNKLFECFAAGVPVVASDVPTMRRIVLDNPGGPLGALCDPSRAESIAAALRSVLQADTHDGEQLRRRCLAAAAGRWNWQLEARHLTAIYDELADLPPRDG